MSTNSHSPSLAIVKLRANDQVHINRLYKVDGQAAAGEEIQHLAQGECKGPGWILAETFELVECRAVTLAKPGDILLVGQDMAGVVLFFSVRVAKLCVMAGGIKPLVGWDEAFAYWRRLEGKPEATWITAPVEDDDEPEPWLPPTEAKEGPCQPPDR
jgi:hypothetical protein